jgi:hypothetical protein
MSERTREEEEDNREKRKRQIDIVGDRRTRGEREIQTDIYSRLGLRYGASLYTRTNR